MNDPEFDKLCFVAELEKLKPELKSYTPKKPTAEPDVALLLPIVLAGIRKSVLLSPRRLVLSGWKDRGYPFITPKIDEAIQLAKALKCCTSHGLFDGDKPGQFYACHAERQQLMEWLDYVNVEYMYSGEGKVFACDTSIVVCNDCRHFFNRAAEYFNIQVFINGARYGPA
jgi:hypothetical protein